MERYTQVPTSVMASAIAKLITQLNKDNIIVLADDSNGNLVFIQGAKSIKISQHSFYRYSGMTQITRTKKDSQGNDTNWTEVIPVTDDDWLQKFIKPIIYKLLEV